MSDVVIDDDVNEAIRLVERSRDSTKPGVTAHSHRSVSTADRIKQIISRLKSLMKDGDTSISVKGIKEKCSEEGISGEQVGRFLDEYENMDVWHINQSKTKLTFL
jgi:DNA replication licensing factor MCM7